MPGDTIRNGDLGAFARQMASYAKLGIDTTIISAPGAEAAPWIEDRTTPAARMLAELG